LYRNSTVRKPGSCRFCSSSSPGSAVA
jgi:hypothetical protein